MEEMLKGYIKECKEFLLAMAKRNEQFTTVLNQKFSELPLLMDKGTELMNNLVGARLNGEDITSCEWCKEAIYEIEFDFDDNTNLACNNGKLYLIADIANKLKLNDIEKEARQCIYE